MDCHYKQQPVVTGYPRFVKVGDKTNSSPGVVKEEGGGIRAQAKGRAAVWNDTSTNGQAQADPSVLASLINTHADVDPIHDFVYAQGRNFYIKGQPHFFAGAQTPALLSPQCFFSSSSPLSALVGDWVGRAASGGGFLLPRTTSSFPDPNQSRIRNRNCGESSFLVGGPGSTVLQI